MEYKASLAALLSGIGFFLAGLAAFWKAWKLKNGKDKNHDDQAS